MFVIFQRSRLTVSKDDRELLDGCKFQSEAVRLAFIDKVRDFAFIMFAESITFQACMATNFV